MPVRFKGTGFIKNFHKNSNNEELNRERLESFLRSILSAGFLTLLIVKNEVYSDRLRKLFSSFGIVEGDYENNGAFYIITSRIPNGIMVKNHKILIFTEEELFKEHISLGDEKIYKGERVDFFETVRELNTGDYVVHAEHGIAKFMGIKTVASRGLIADYLELVYAGGDKIFVPTGKIYLVHKYISSGETKPELSKLGGKSWEKAKKKAKQKIEEVAEDLVKLYAKRKSEGGFAFSKEDEDYLRIEEDFEYEETEDQAKAIQDVLSDMAKAMPMDRLVCGDVGYGKTEVAIRAAYKAALDGKQVILIAPTTLLVDQHYINFKKRFEKYPVNIAYLSRLIKSVEEKQTIKLLEMGTIDIIIGTHKLLSDKIKFHDPGLFIIDEEQKFGALQKEKIKKIRSSIDVLALSATPIPRTLYLSMSGIRDLSIINTPPAGRKNIITQSALYDDNIVKEYVYRELNRGGQVYFVDDRISHLDAIYENFKKIMPDINIGIVHGRLNLDQLEDVMQKFYRKHYDLLLSTSIIESGIDNPNVNTIIINNAENFGLSQLYQLRGRVGRSYLQAYCLLLVNSADLTKDQKKRLESFKEYNELGSGFKLAMADLEIRGAGNILGEAQSGNMQSVGLEMCMQILKDEISKIQGKVLPPEVFPEIKVNMDMYIPDNYITDNRLKLITYRKLSGCGQVREVINIKEELKDRFGRLPKETENLISASELKVYMKNVKVRLIEIIDYSFNIEFHASAKSFSNSIIRFINDKEAASKYIINFLSEYKLKIRLKGLQEKNLDVFKVAINILQQIQYYVNI
jgi:transcription-repair coupling factor (superfamily II helicase)